MKINYLLLIVAIGALITACTKKNTPNPMENVSLDSNWELIFIQKKAVVALDKKPLPYIKLSKSTSKMTGFAGCNSIFSSITTFTDKELSFGNIAATKKMCSNFETEQEFNSLMRQVNFYKVEGNHLILMDQSNKILLKFKSSPAKK